MASMVQGVLVGVASVIAAGFCFYMWTRSKSDPTLQEVRVVIDEATVPASKSASGNAPWDDAGGKPDPFVRVTCVNKWGSRTVQCPPKADSVGTVKLNAECSAPGEDPAAPGSHATKLWITAESTVTVDLLEDDSPTGDGLDPSRVEVIGTWEGLGRDFLAAGRVPLVPAPNLASGAALSVVYSCQK